MSGKGEWRCGARSPFPCIIQGKAGVGARGMPAADIAAAQCWSSSQTVTEVYREADDSTLTRSVLEADELRGPGGPSPNSAAPPSEWVRVWVPRVADS